jgi:hypothetical protein
MEKDVRYVFALLLMETLCDEVDPTSAAYEPAAVETFMATRIRFVRVKVCSV